MIKVLYFKHTSYTLYIIISGKASDLKEDV
nr:MAG TPA: hypothetical protein [Caudoviricetes sp.]